MVEIVLNSGGVRELLQCAELEATVREQAERVATSAGDGFAVDTFTGHDRAHAYVTAETDEARKACYQDNVLLKALGV